MTDSKVEVVATKRMFCNGIKDKESPSFFVSKKMADMLIKNGEVKIKAPVKARTK
jgi:hypothetical protein